MIYLLQLIVLGIFVLILLQLFSGLRRRDDRSVRHDGEPEITIDGTARAADSSPAKNAAETLKEFENARAALKSRYPAVFAMLGGYLNEHTIHEHGGVEGAVREMLDDWRPRREEIVRELTHMLAENDSEDELRAIVLAACDASFEEEGYRHWLTWLLGRFNAF